MRHNTTTHSKPSRATSLVVNEHRTETFVRHACFSLVVMSCAVYVALVFLTVITAIDSKEVARRSSALTTEIAQLEAEYFTLAQSIVEHRAGEFALTGVAGKHFVTRAPSLGLAPSTVR